MHFLEKNIEAFYNVLKIIDELHELLQSSFGGAEAEKVRQMVEEVAYKEHQIDIEQRGLLKIILHESDEMPTWLFYLWMKVIEKVSSISNLSEKLSCRVRMILDVK